MQLFFGIREDKKNKFYGLKSCYKAIFDRNFMLCYHIEKILSMIMVRQLIKNCLITLHKVFGQVFDT